MLFFYRIAGDKFNIMTFRRLKELVKYDHLYHDQINIIKKGFDTLFNTIYFLYISIYMLFFAIFVFHQNFKNLI